MSSRSERYLANAEKCQRFADAAYTSGTKRLYGALASNWRRLAEEADWTDKIESRFLLDKIRQANFLRQIDKTEDAIQKFEVALEGEPLLNVQGAPSIAANQKEKEPQIRSLPVLAAAEISAHSINHDMLRARVRARVMGSKWMERK
jgi:hypothetical protein